MLVTATRATDIPDAATLPQRPRGGAASACAVGVPVVDRPANPRGRWPSDATGRRSGPGGRSGAPVAAACAGPAPAFGGV